jgi:hypothetical protein
MNDNKPITESREFRHALSDARRYVRAGLRTKTTGKRAGKARRSARTGAMKAGA